MLFNLLTGELLVGNTAALLFCGQLVLHRGLHPSALAFCVNRVSEEKSFVTIGFGFHNIPTVVHHAHQVPIGRFRLRVLENIEASDRETLGSDEMRHIDVDVPVQPRPEFVTVADWSIGELGMVRPLILQSEERIITYLSQAEKPCFAIVQAQLHSLNLVSTPVISISFHSVCVLLQ